MNYAKIDDLNAKKDELVTANDVIVLVDPKAIFFIAGTEMDFEVYHSNLNLPPIKFRVLTISAYILLRSFVLSNFPPQLYFLGN
jgi:hypothetical protein